MGGTTALVNHKFSKESTFSCIIHVCLKFCICDNHLAASFRPLFPFCLCLSLGITVIFLTLLDLQCSYKIQETLFRVGLIYKQ